MITAAEHKACDAQFESGRLRVRPKILERLGAALLVAVGVAFAVVSLFLGAVAVIFVPFGLAGATLSLIRLSGQVVATPDALSVRWFRTSEIEWSRVHRFELVERMLWWAGVFWPPAEVVELVFHGGERVNLWPTLGIRAGTPGATNPTAATIKRGLLERYRDTFAPPA